MMLELVSKVRAILYWLTKHVLVERKVGLVTLSPMKFAKRDNRLLRSAGYRRHRNRCQHRFCSGRLSVIVRHNR